MAVVPCYICDKAMEIDDLIRHVRSHSDAEALRAAERVVRKRNGKAKPSGPVDTGVGTVVKKKSPEYIELDENNQSVVESTNGTEPV